MQKHTSSLKSGGVRWTDYRHSGTNVRSCLRQSRIRKPLRALPMEKNIFQVLGIKSSTFGIKTRPKPRGGLIKMNIRGSDGLMKPTPSPYNDNAPDHSGGMGLVTSTSGFATMLKDLLKPSPAQLRAETVDLMFKPQFPLGSDQYKGLLTQNVSVYSSV